MRVCNDCKNLCVCEEVSMPYGTVILCIICLAKRCSSLAQEQTNFALHCTCSGNDVSTPL